MTQAKKKLVFSWVLILSLVISVVSPGSTLFAKAEEAYDGYVYVTVERFTLGQGLAAEPKKIGYHDGETMETIVKRGYGEDCIEKSGTWFNGFEDGGEPEGWTVEKIPEKILGALQKGASGDYAAPPIALNDIKGRDKSKKTLSGNDYTGQSSWMFSLNNELASLGIDSLKAGTDFETNAVYRLEFGIYNYSSDLNIAYDGNYLIDFPNKDDLIRNIVDYKGDKTLSVYKNAVTTLEDWDATAEEVNTAEAALDSAEKYQDIYKAALTNLKDSLTDQGYGNEWAVLSIAKNGLSDAQWNYKYIENVEKTVEEKATNVLDTSGWSYSTENARVIIGLNAAGGNPQDVSGYNLLEPLADYTKVSGQGINGIVFALIAFDTRNYDIPELKATDDVQATKEGLINGILDAELEAGGWNYYKSYTDEETGETISVSADVDLTGMAIQALAPYYKKNEKVTAAVDRALKVLSDIQDNSGMYKGYDGKLSSCSTAQVVCALSALGMDADRDERFIKSGNSALDALLAFYVASEKAFKNVSTDSNSNSYASLQVIYALTAYDLMQNNGGRLYDMSKVHQHKVSIKNAKAATCTAIGYTGDKVCEDCGDVLEKGTETAKLAHTPVEIPAVAATETTAGKTAGKKCSVCGEILAAPKDVPATGKKDDTTVKPVAEEKKEAVASEYKITSTDTASPTVEYSGDSNSKETIVTIQNTTTGDNGNAYKVTKVADNAFAGNTNITVVTLGTNVTEIGANAFKNCTKLTDIITQNEQLTTIGASAFAGAKALTELDFSESNLKTIDASAFSGCKKLKTIKLNGNKLTKVGKNAFKNVKKNAKITIYAKNKKTYNKVVKLIKKSGAKKVKYAYKKKK